MAVLVVREPGRMAYAVPIEAPLRVGRDESCELTLVDRQASRVHAVIAPSGDGLVVEDLGSRHGTFVNGVRTTRALLACGDRIQIGASLLDIAVQDAAPAFHSTLPDDIGSLAASPHSRQLRVLHQAAQAFTAAEPPEVTLRPLLDAIVDLLGVERGAIALEERRGGPRLVAGEPAALSRSHLHAVRQRGETVATPTSLLAPLRGRRGVLGILVLEDHRRAEPFPRERVELATVLGVLVAAVLDGLARADHAAVLEERLRDLQSPEPLLGASAGMARLREDIGRFAAAAAPVHIRGETGTGKELIARRLHALSPRAAQPFVPLNCAALPDAALESELFGHVRGAFTGAVKDRRGRLALADRGTLFLDEIGDLSLAAQAKLLRALEDGEVVALGSDRAVRVDVRILSATHKDLRREVAKGTFREDLLFRLNTLELVAPPLRERPEDITLLAEEFMGRARQPFTALTPAARTLLLRHPWPGNVRELRHEIERATIVGSPPFIDAEDLSPHVRAAPRGGVEPRASLAMRFAGLEDEERHLVEEGLERAQGNVSEAARLLGISRIMMRRRLLRYGLRDGTEGEMP